MNTIKNEIRRIATYTIIVASLLIGTTFIMNEHALAAEKNGAVNNAEQLPVFNPFFTNNPDLDRFFFERDVLGIGGDFEDNPLFKKGNRNAFERDDNFQADN